MCILFWSPVNLLFGYKVFGLQVSNAFYFGVYHVSLLGHQIYSKGRTLMLKCPLILLQLIPTLKVQAVKMTSSFIC